MEKRHRIQLPKIDSRELEQDEVYFYFDDGEEKRKIKFHDYEQIYKIPGLYEQIFYDRLHCNSPNKVADILKLALAQSTDDITELRVLDFGAGNGVMGETLKKLGVSRLIGVDIIPEAYEAALRDRPGVYDAYYIQDFTSLNEEVRQEISSWQLDCMITVAALGFGDIPTEAFIEAFNIIKKEGWVAFNIKESFLDRSDDTGFSKMIRELIFSEYMDIYQIQRYRHRISIDGEPIYYFAISAKKNADVPQSFLKFLGVNV